LKSDFSLEQQLLFLEVEKKASELSKVTALPESAANLTQQITSEKCHFSVLWTNQLIT